MNCLAHQAVVARSEILRKLEQDLFFVPPCVATGNLCVPSSKSYSFLVLDFKLQRSALAAEVSNIAYSCLWLLECLRALGCLHVSAGSFIRKWWGLLSHVHFCVWAHWACARGRMVFAGVSYPNHDGDLWQEWSLGPRLNTHSSSPRLAIQQRGHVLFVCSQPQLPASGPGRESVRALCPRPLHNLKAGSWQWNSQGNHPSDLKMRCSVIYCVLLHCSVWTQQTGACRRPCL